MSTFPTYPGELPTCLSPFNLRHYFLLAYWVFYRPTALKCYLYQIDPVLYLTEGGIGNFLKTFRYPAYRNLYLLLPLVAMLLAFALAGVTTLIYWLQGGKVALLVWATGVAFGVVWGVASGVTIGVAFGVASGVTRGMAIGVATGMATGVAIDVVIGVASGMATGMATGVASGVGILGVPTYLPLLWRSFFWDDRFRWHPIRWSESHILPLPFTSRAIERMLSKSEVNGFSQLTSVLSNPFHYASLQRALRRTLDRHPDPVRYLYHLLHHPDLGSYVFAPVDESQWRDIPAVRELFLGELSGQRVKVFGDDRYVYQLTKFRRDLRHTPITDLAALFYDLLQADKDDFTDFKLHKYTDIYCNITNYHGGAEVATSYTLFQQSLGCKAINDIPPSQTNLPFPLPAPRTSIRTAIITAQIQLKSIAQDIQSALTMTSRVNQLAAYARANDDLQQLESYITANTLKPERSILLLIIQKWQEIIIAASGAIAKAEIRQPVANPYVCGNPVTGDIFVGREDILRRIEELWMATHPPSLVIYGHRRMGKSSILLNLQGKLNKDTILIDFNMQRVGLVNSTAELLHNLALRLYDDLEPTVRGHWAEPEFSSFNSGNIYSIFDRFLIQLNLHRNNKRYAVAIDEFELIERQIEQKILEPQLLEYFRSIIQTYPWLIFAFAGLHTLEEMTRDYWHPLFSSVTRIPVGFLTPAAARQLITQPTPDFNLDYDADAIDLIIAKTNGQPYLVQLICHSLVSRFNDLNFVAAPFGSAQGTPHSTRFSTADVETVITNSQFEQNGSAYFHGIWDRADANQQLMLQHFAIEPLTDRELEIRTKLTPELIKLGLDNLKAHDVIFEQRDRYTYCVPLMQDWVAQHHAIDF